MWALVILVVIFPKTEAIGTGDALQALIQLLILYGMAMSSVSYFFSFFFKTSAGAQIVTLFVCIFSGLIFSIIGIVLRILPDTRDYYHAGIRHALALFPPCAFGEAMHNLVLLNTWVLHILIIIKRI